MNDVKNKFIYLVLSVLLIFLVGTLGYIIIENWNFMDSLYMTVITMSSVGYEEVRPLSEAGRMFTVFLIIGGIGIMTYVFTTLAYMAVEGQVKNIFRRIKMENAISRLRSHYIICGNTHTGMSIAAELRKTRRDFVIVVKNKDEAEKLLAGGFNVVEGDATEDDALAKAGISKAEGIFCALKNDRDNAFIALSARGLNPTIKIVSVQNENEKSMRSKLLRSGVNMVISPYFIGGLRMVSEMVRPNVVSFLDSMLRETKSDIRFEEILLKGKKKLIGKTLKNFKEMSAKDALVVALKKGGENKYEINPEDEKIFSENDILVVLGSSVKIGKLSKSLI